MAGGMADRLLDQTDARLFERGSQTELHRTKSGDSEFEEYVSDPAKPVPSANARFNLSDTPMALNWPEWLVDDQREAVGTA